MAKKKGLPNWNEIVLCTVTRVTPFAAWCRLDEYETEDGHSIEGMIHISEVANRWVKDIRNFVKPNKQYVTKVVRIDRQKGHLNLSLKRVGKFEKREKMENFRRKRRGKNMLAQVAKRVGKDYSEAEKEVLKKLEKYFTEKEGEEDFDLFYAFERINEDDEILKKAGIKEEWAEKLEEIIKSGFRPKKITLKAEFQLRTPDPEGVKKIRDVLKKLEKKTGGEVKYISAPKYTLEMTSRDPKDAERKMEKGLEKAIKNIEASGGIGSYRFDK